MDQPRYQPLVGLTGHAQEAHGGGIVVGVREAYLSAVRAVGGVPVILSPSADLAQIALMLERIDGLLLTGGRDIDPAHFGEAILNDTVAIETERDAFELPLTREAVARDLPLLAICRGCQVLNVAMGGSLWQDLPAQRASEVVHAQHAPRDAVTHTVLVERQSLLARVLAPDGATPIESNTFHHQAVRDVAAPLIATATATDDVIEAVEAPGRRFVLGVQWHPEHLEARRPEHRRIFEAFVAAAAADASARHK